MQSSKQHDAKIHAEVEDFKQLRLVERQHNDPTKFGEGDSTQDL